MKFRKKPVVIEAWQVATYDERTRVLPPMWLVSAITCSPPTVVPHPDGPIDIHTLEGTMTAMVGDWIIKGVKGELYPCKPDIFEATYEPVE